MAHGLVELGEDLDVVAASAQLLDDFAREARSRGIIITPARAFAAGPEAPEAIRVCIGAAADRKVMVEALRTLDTLARDPRVAFSAVV